LPVYTGAKFISLKGTALQGTDQKMAIEFVKINRNRYITTDEKFTVLNLGGSVWVVLQKIESSTYNEMFINRPFNRALEAMAELRKAVA
jgi:hypothetical protein